jgi:metallophosphoesterase (TIGR00282 family)
MEPSFAAALFDRGEASMPKPPEPLAAVWELQLEINKKAANAVNTRLRPFSAQKGDFILHLSHSPLSDGRAERFENQRFLSFVQILFGGSKPAECYHQSSAVSHCGAKFMRILFIGDIFGRPGRTIVKDRLPGIVRDQMIDLVIANGENSAAGFGITPALAEELFELNIDVITTGNHVWDKREIIDYFQMAEGNGAGPSRRILRPANYPADLPGWGLYEGQKAKVPYAVINLQGRIFMASNEDPFRVADQLLNKIEAKIIFVDFHAEATSEKISLGWYLDGRVTAVVGTHTHVPTADERVLPKGTAYITDVGMTGPYDGVIGVKKELVVGKFLNGMPVRFEPATGDVRLCAVVVDCDEKTGRARDIERIMLS